MYKLPECHPSERIRYMRKEIPIALKRASQLITDSESVRQEVIDFFGWPAERVHAVPLAASHEFRPRSEAELRSFLGGYGLAPGEYCLYAGTIEPRKNLDVLLGAYEGLPEAAKKRWPLVLAGYAGWRSEQIHRRILKGTNEGWVRYLGFVPGGHLPLLYSGARAFCFPSLYEGFGLPVLESMASGVPVVCSNAASLSEVAGDVAATCDPKDASALRALIAQSLEDDEWRGRAIAGGVRRAASYSWERTASETVRVYREAAERR
jgi:alpha-1,3-rhamnosyl/mannosyltransferase